MRFGGAKMPAPQPVPAARTPVDPAVQQAQQELQSEQAQAAGRMSTILTSGRGALTQPPVLRKTLLGQ